MVNQAFSMSLDAVGKVIGSLAWFWWGNKANYQGNHNWPVDACPTACQQGCLFPASTVIVHIPFFIPLPPSIHHIVGGIPFLADCRVQTFAQEAWHVYQLGWHFPSSSPQGISLDAVVHTLQLRYHSHSIQQYLAQQIQHCLAATTLQCWKRLIWLGH
jgi:hypothetical protein